MGSYPDTDIDPTFFPLIFGQRRICHRHRKTNTHSWMKDKNSNLFDKFASNMEFCQKNIQDCTGRRADFLLRRIPY